LRSTFGTTGIDYRPATASFHPGSKAMAAFALDDTGLESSFHFYSRTLGNKRRWNLPLAGPNCQYLSCFLALSRPCG
jgi:hypothetical protein